MRIVFESPIVVDLPFFADGNFVGLFDVVVKTIAWPLGEVGGDLINLRLAKLLLLLLLLLTISTGGKTRFKSPEFGEIWPAGDDLDVVVGMRDGLCADSYGALPAAVTVA